MNKSRTNSSIPRRNFLHATLSATAGLCVLPTLAGAAASKPAFPVIDTHTHFYDPTRPQGVPWPDKQDSLLYRKVMPANYRALAQPLGVTGTVVVEASVWVEDNQWILALADKDLFLKGLVGNLKPGSKDFGVHLNRFVQNPRFRGIRIREGQLDRDISQPEFLNDLKRLAASNLALDINFGPETLTTIAKLAQSIPDLKIIINHVANVRIDGKTPPAIWREGMTAVAKQPNVCCKVSGLVEGTGKTDGNAPVDVDYYRPVLDGLWELFGEDRLIYGSNWPVSERFAPLAVVHKIARDYFTAKGSVAVQKILGANALRVYGVKS